MKTIFTFSFLIIINVIAYLKQVTVADITVCSIINSICNTDLTNPIAGLKLDSAFNLTYGLPGVSTDVLYSKNRCDGLTSTPDSCKDGIDALKYDVYFPDSIGNKRINYDSCGLPYIIMLHGGAFDECSDKQNHGIVYLCRELAKRGFVVFNVEYRRGVLIDIRRPPVSGYIYKYVSAQQVLTIYRASQDVRGFIRTAIYKQRTNSNGARFRIDTTKLFLGGISAGSLAAMNAAYYERQGQIDSAWPGASAVLGDIDQPYYIGDTNINFIPLIRGVVDLWGAIGMHKSKYNNPESFFDGNSNISAIIAFQGDSDDIFPVYRNKLYFSPDSSKTKKINYNTERNCLVIGTSFSVDDSAASADAASFGADGIYKIFKNINKPVEVYIDCTMTHGMDEVCDTCPPFDSDFGTGYDNQDSVYSYIAARTATYFITILAGKVTALDRSRFVECRNYRVRCDTADADSCVYTLNQEAAYKCKDF